MKNVAKIFIQNSQGEILVLLRNKTARYFPGCWDLPGGLVEKGENTLDCIVRELKEETNLDIAAEKVEAVYELDIDNIGRPTHKFTIYSTNTASGDLKISNEHTAYKWAPIEDIFKLPLEPYLRLYLNYFLFLKK